MTTASSRLTKSLFKLALECPTKLYFAGKKEYFDASAENGFMAQLAEGGHQVGEMAKLMYPDGVDLSDEPQVAQLELTRSLLQRENVTIFEAALCTDALFVRVDILVKRGSDVELVEVKAKSFDPETDSVFKGKHGAFRGGFLPYVQDIAYQKHVAQLAYPALHFSCSLMFANKAARASADGLNQLFPVTMDGSRVRVRRKEGVTASSVGTPLLVRVPVDCHADEVLTSPLDLGASGAPSFADGVTLLATAYQRNERLPTKLGAACRKCQFNLDDAPDGASGQRSGFKECWRAAAGFTDKDFADPSSLQLWNSRRIDQFVQEGKFKQSQLTAEDVGFDGSAPGQDGLKLAHIHWYQSSRKWPGGGDFYLHSGMREVMETWQYPLHFIDFETATVAIPFHKGSKPYETVAFQFSHHVLERDGRVRHQSQFLQTTPGVNPNIAFLRALKAALSNDGGTVMRWAAHENTVLNQIVDTLLEPGAEHRDAAELVDFARTLTGRADGEHKHVGERAMVDLCRLSQKFFFHPSTEGSPSLKKVLPALMKSSAALRRLYSQPVYGGSGIQSLNFKAPVAWWQKKDGKVCDPYKLLPPVAEPATSVGSAISTLRDGGAAMAAYVRLQFADVGAEERRLVESALLRYCELDTLAMVMAVQAWTAWLTGSAPLPRTS